jgi:outer membrane protein OmpA-like peptidoglycan-associated protein
MANRTRWPQIVAGLILLASGTMACAAEPAKDHPLVGRYEGAVLDAYQAHAYEEVGLIDAPLQNRRRDEKAARSDLLRVAGKVSLHYYKLPDGRSLREVQRNYEASLKAKGFTLVFSCATSDGSCYQPNPDRAANTAPDDFATVLDTPEWPRIGRGKHFVSTYFETSGRYVLAKYNGPAGAVYASIALAEHSPERGNFAFVRVVESKAMETDKIVFVDATAMQKSLNETGRVNLYGIHFDVDKDTIKPDSQPTLDEMTKLMRNSPQLRLAVVGHTDSQGDAGHNADLSRRRSQSVVAALAKAGIDAKRFTPRGAGASEPVAPNDTEAGRAKNRRVELLLRM